MAGKLIYKYNKATAIILSHISNKIVANPVDTGRYRPSAQEMDDSRANNIAYQYLCHLEEAKT